MLKNELTAEEISKIVEDKEKRYSLEEILNDDPLGLLMVEKKKFTTSITEDDRLIDSFEEINKFIDENQREPERNQLKMGEFKLYSRLKSLKEDFDKMDKLKEYDRHNLLLEKPNFDSVDDILNNDILNIFDEETEGLFDFKHTPKMDEREKTDFVAKRKPCKDFEKYEDLFKQVQNDLASGERKLVDFGEDNLKEGSFYVHNGILMLLEKINITQEEKTFKTGKRVRKDGRTRCIFENGTESNMLYRSVAKALYANGKIVTKSKNQAIGEWNRKFNVITDEDKEVGYIYVLKSKSSDEQISSLKNLYKIGFSKNKVEERIKNAEKEPTYLMAPVETIAIWKCYNMNPQKFENLVHTFFKAVCLDLEVTDIKGIIHKPREWFMVPLQIIDKVVELIIVGDITKYCYDKDKECILNLEYMDELLGD